MASVYVKIPVYRCSYRDDRDREIEIGISQLEKTGTNYLTSFSLILLCLKMR